MAIRRLTKLLADSKRQAKARERKLQTRNRTMQMERMEDRHLMAQFKVQIDPQPGAVLDDTDTSAATAAKNTLNVAPTQIDFNFDAFGAITLPATVVTPLQQTNYLSQFIKIRRSGFDDAFSAAPGSNDVLITPGFLGTGDRNTQIVMRFNEPLVDDLSDRNPADFDELGRKALYHEWPVRAVRDEPGAGFQGVGSRSATGDDQQHQR